MLGKMFMYMVLYPTLYVECLVNDFFALYSSLVRRPFSIKNTMILLTIVPIAGVATFLVLTPVTLLVALPLLISMMYDILTGKTEYDNDYY